MMVGESTFSTTDEKRPGRPLSIQSTSDLDAGILEYFGTCRKEKRPATMLGLAIHLGVPMRTLHDYKDRDGYGEILELAIEYIEHQLELRLIDKETYTPGIIFALKNNFGWTDAQHTQLSGSVSLPVQPQVLFVDPDDDDA